MWTVIDCITGQHDLRLVVVAGLICLLGCFAAVSLLARAMRQSGIPRHLWLAATAFVGGGGIWATHFVAMLAYNYNMPVGYDLWLTIFSIAIAIGVTWLGVCFVVQGANWAIAGGLVAGLAVAAMHFTGMFALRGPLHLVWDGRYVVASIVLGVLLTMVAFRLVAAEVPSLRRRFGAATFYSLGIVALHFTAMAGVTLIPDPRFAVPAQAVEPESFAIAVAAVTVLIIGLGLTGSMVDQHLADRSIQEAVRLRAHVDELEATRERLEKATERLTLALEQAAASSQAKSQFLAAMSHELRTPLNAVIGFSQMIAEEGFGPVGNARYIEFARTIASSGNHLLAVINDILDLSSLDAGAMTLQLEDVDLNDVVDESIRMIDGQATIAAVAIHKDMPDDLPLICADGRRLRQVVLNLLSNAVKFTGAGGEIRIAASADDRRVTIAVSDNGVGIAPENISRALDRFGQVDNSFSRTHEGTGLGLPLSRDLVELHGGTLELRSALGVGTSVIVTLPRNSAARDSEKRQVA